MNAKKLLTPTLLIALLHATATASIAVVEVLYLRYTLEASYTMIGSVLGAAAIGYLLFAPFLKELPKAIGRGVYLSWTSFILAVAAILAVNINNAAMYLVSKTIILLLAPITFTTLIGFIEDELKYNADLQKCYAALTLAAMTGGIIGFLAAGQLGIIAYGHAYILSTASFLAAGFIGLTLPKSTQPIRNKPTLNLVERLETAFSKKYKTITIIVLATNAYWALRDITIPLLLIQNGYSTATIGALFALGALMGVISSVITRVLLRKNHPERVMVASLAIATIASILLPFGGLIVLGVLYAIYVSAEVALTPAISDRVEEVTSQANPYITSLSTASALAWTITPLIVGILLEAGLGYRVMLFLGGLLIAFAYWNARNAYTPNEYFPEISIKKNKKTLTW